VFAVARAGDTASEIYVRIRAALDAFDGAGIETDVDALRCSPTVATRQREQSSRF
jgi:hypothetical protein